MSRDLVVVADAEALAGAAADEFAATVAAAAAARGRAGVALAGGSTPLGAYRRLAARSDVPWPRVHVFFSDERCVPPDHPDSNYGRAKTALLDRVPIPAAQVFRMRGEMEPQAAADEYEAVLDAWDDTFDLVILGVGADGHVASLFPETDALDETSRAVRANWVPQLRAHRITLTLAEINAARRVLVLVSGADKAAAVARAWGSEVDPIAPVPAGLVLPRAGSALWLVDRAAATLLGSVRPLAGT